MAQSHNDIAMTAYTYHSSNASVLQYIGKSSVSQRSHIRITTISHRYHLGITSVSRRYHISITSVSYRIAAGGPFLHRTSRTTFRTISHHLSIPFKQSYIKIKAKHKRAAGDIFFLLAPRAFRSSTYRILPPRASRKLDLSHTNSASLPVAQLIAYYLREPSREPKKRKFQNNTFHT